MGFINLSNAKFARLSIPECREIKSRNCFNWTATNARQPEIVKESKKHSRPSQIEDKEYSKEKQASKFERIYIFVCFLCVFACAMSNDYAHRSRLQATLYFIIST